MFSEEMLWLYAWYSVNKSDIEKVKRGSMALKKKAVTGMKDILPREMAVRQRVLSTIRRVYGGFGFTERNGSETKGIIHNSKGVRGLWFYRD